MDCSMPGLAVPHHLLQFAKIMPFASVVLEKTPESPLDSMEIKPDNLNGNQAWILIGRADDEAEAPVFWSPDVNSLVTGKVPDPGKDWGQKEKRVSEDEMVIEYYTLWNKSEKTNTV